MNRFALRRVMVAGIAGIGIAGLASTPAMAGFGGASGHQPSNNLVFQKVDAATGQLLAGASFTGDTCTRADATTLDFSCQDLGQFAWFRDDLPEFGTTPIQNGGFQNEVPVTDSYNTDGTAASLDTTLQTVHVSESVAPAGYTTIKGTATVYRSGNIWKASDLPAGVTLVHSNNYYYLRFADTKQPPVYPTAHTTTTTKQVTTTTTVKVTTGDTCTDPATVYQVDAYTPTTAAQLSVVRHLGADNRLTWREDRALWGHSKHEFVTVKASDVTAAGSLQAAINAKTRVVANLGGRIAIGATYTTAWALTGTATTTAPWGTTHDQNQVSYTHTTTPARVCTPTYTTRTITKTITVPVTTTTWVCSDGTTEPNATTACPTRNSVGG